MTVWEGGLLRQPPSTGPSYVSLLLQRLTQRTTHSLKPTSSITTPGCLPRCSLVAPGAVSGVPGPASLCSKLASFWLQLLKVTTTLPQGWQDSAEAG